MMLRVRFAEVSRSAMQELGGASLPVPTAKATGSAGRRHSSIPRRIFDQDKGLVFSDFLNLFLFNTEEQLGAVIKRAEGQGPVSEPCRAEPDHAGRQGSDLPRRRRVSLSGRPGDGRPELGRDDRLQGVRRPSEVHADGHCGRHDSAEGRARGELARLRQRRRAAGLPRSRARHTPHRDVGRASRRPDIRHRRHARSERERNPAARSGHRRYPDPRLSVPQPGLYRRTRPSWS